MPCRPKSGVPLASRISPIELSHRPAQKTPASETIAITISLDERGSQSPQPTHLDLRLINLTTTHPEAHHVWQLQRSSYAPPLTSRHQFASAPTKATDSYPRHNGTPASTKAPQCPDRRVQPEAQQAEYAVATPQGLDASVLGGRPERRDEQEEDEESKPRETASVAARFRKSQLRSTQGHWSGLSGDFP